MLIFDYNNKMKGQYPRIFIMTATFNQNSVIQVTNTLR